MLRISNLIELLLRHNVESAHAVAITIEDHELGFISDATFAQHMAYAKEDADARNAELTALGYDGCASAIDWSNISDMA